MNGHGVTSGAVIAWWLIVGGALAAAMASGSAGAAESDTTPSRTVLVTGANRGLGLELARQYAAAGWQVIGTARSPKSATELAALGVRVLQLDVADDASVARLASALGETSLDLLINNAGIMDRNGSLEEVDVATMARVLDVNALGPMRVTKALLPALRRGQTRQVVSITSGLGSIADNTSGDFYGYRESKAALNMFIRSLAADLADEGFTCIVISPGWVQTDMGGSNANLTPAESVRAMRAVFDNLTPAASGRFYNHDGSLLPW